MHTGILRLPAVTLAKDSLSFRTQGIFKAVDYTLQGIAAYERNFWWTFMVTASFLMSIILSFVISVFVIVIIRTIRDIPLISHDIKEDRTKLLLLLVFIFAIFGPLYLLGSLLVMVSFYLRKWDRIVLYLYLVFLLFLPFVFKAVSMVFSAPTSAELRAVVDVNESKGNRYALSLLKASNNPVERFSYALALKREGRYGEAIDIYKNLVAAKPNALIYNNLANCYVAINDIETAKELYTKANGIKSSILSISASVRKSLD
jgi:tetratricopeptide (TPR) repeat protein